MRKPSKEAPRTPRCFPATVGRKYMLRVIAIVLLTLSSIASAKAADVKVLAALAVQDALDPLAARFSRDRGHAVQIAYSTVGAIRKRLAAGERADVVVL